MSQTDKPGNFGLYFSSRTAPNAHLQRSALLLLNAAVYVAFAGLPEHYNGWLFGYQRQNNGGNYSLPQTAE